MKKPMVATSRSEKGQSLMELSLGIIILLILLAGIVDLGRAIFTKFAMQDAAEEGIVYGTSFPTDCNQINQRVEYNLSNLAFQGGMTITAEINLNDGTFKTCDWMVANQFAQIYAGKELRITVTKTFQVSMPLLGAFIGQEIPLTVVSRGVILRPQPD